MHVIIVHEKVTSVLHELGRYFYFNTVRLLVEIGQGF